MIGVIAKELKASEQLITRKKLLVGDLGATPSGLVQLRKALEKEFSLKVPRDTFKRAYGGRDHRLREKGGGEARPRDPRSAADFFGGVRPN